MAESEESSEQPSLEEIEASVGKILQHQDLDTLSSKKVRKTLEEEFKVDLSSRKTEVDEIILRLINDKQHENNPKEDENADKNGSSPNKKDGEHNSDDDSDDASDDDSPPSKKPRGDSTEASTSKSANQDSDSSSDTNDTNDAALAKNLRNQELGIRSRRNEKKERAKPEKKRAGPAKGTSIYSRECILSDDLAAVLGTNKMGRSDVVKNMWKIFKERELQDPSNKQFIICDAALEKVFKTKRFKAFGMMKILKNHIYDPKLDNKE